MTEKSSKSSLPSIAIVLSLIAVVGVGVILFSLFKKHTPDKLEVNAQDIALATGVFTLGAFSGDDGARFPIRGCKSKNECYFDTSLGENPVPGYAWRSLAAASLFDITKDPKYSKAVEHDFHNILNGVGINVATAHAIATAARLTADIKMLQSISGIVVSVHSAMSSEKHRIGIQSLDAMSLSGRSRVISEFVYAMKDPNLRKVLSNLQIADDQWEKYQGELLQTALTLQEYATASAKRDGISMNFSGDATFTDQSCWPLWALSGVYRASMHPESLLAPLRKSTVALRFWIEGNAQQTKQATQDALACLDAMLDLSSAGVEFEESARTLFESSILPAWDASTRPVCIGDNGFPSNLGTGTGCDKTPRLLSDNAWLTRVISRSKENFVLKRPLT